MALVLLRLWLTGYHRLIDIGFVILIRLDNSYNNRRDGDVGAQGSEWPAVATCNRSLKLDQFQKQGKPHTLSAVRTTRQR